MVTSIWVNTASGNGLLPVGTKPLPKVNIDLSSSKVQWYSSQCNFTRDTRQPSISKFSLKITYVEFHSNLPGVNQLANFSIIHQWLWWLNNTSTTMIRSNPSEQFIGSLPSFLSTEGLYFLVFPWDLENFNTDGWLATRAFKRVKSIKIMCYKCFNIFLMNDIVFVCTHISLA